MQLLVDCKVLRRLPKSVVRFCLSAVYDNAIKLSSSRNGSYLPVPHMAEEELDNLI